MPLLLLAAVAGCLSDAREPQGSRSEAAATNSPGGPSMKLTVTSTAFADGQRIPKKYSGEGEDLSPALAWTGVPEGTRELALICDDPDAPQPEPWMHWVIYKIPAGVTALREGIPREPQLTDPRGALQGKNSWPKGETIGYRGPMPPPGHGVHHYHFRVYALDVELAVKAGLDKKALLKAMEGHILAEGRLTGTYQR
jgi:Raf kinase inhibitor-like YbhB/YbcL family protein